MPNMNKLRGKIVEHGYTVATLAERIRMDLCIRCPRSTLYRRIAEGGQSFTVREIRALATLLHLSMQDIKAIFLDAPAEE